ncbi:Uncharacterised protein [Yersinia intermedia]|nr:Uncharacterised protein [Yersinia intermedia]
MVATIRVQLKLHRAYARLIILVVLLIYHGLLQ